MPVCLYWGEDDFAIAQKVDQLKEIVDPAWFQFNYEKIPGDQPDAILQGLTQAMTPPFGMGKRLVWIAETTVCQQCSEAILGELEQTLPQIPADATLLLTTRKKPDGRLKSTKILQKYAEVQEFSLIPPWKTDELLKRVQTIAQEVGLKLEYGAAELLAESVGNNTRQLWNELEKLKLYAETSNTPLNTTTVSSLVRATTQNSLQLANAIRQGNTERALELVADLINLNEPALKIVATLIGQFRTWTIVKLMTEKGEKDEKAIASAADIGNPKRIYFLRKEIQSISGEKLLRVLPILLQLEVSLKKGADSLSTLQTKIIELCQECQ
ncbi:MAG: DNA polymerase III subunit delta [Chroococcales cyanobacterium]